jgi:hypothetical protein
MKTQKLKEASEIIDIPPHIIAGVFQHAIEQLSKYSCFEPLDGDEAEIFAEAFLECLNNYHGNL